MQAKTSETGSELVKLSNDLAGAVERAGRAVVTVNARHRAASSGVHWSQGVVVTADHTVERDEDITVTLADGRSTPATLAGRDAGTDVAVLKVEGLEIPVAERADSADLRVGNVVLAVARPRDAGLSASLGVVSAVGGSWRTWRGGQIDQMVRLDLTLYEGFSGGPLVDAQGLVAGINTSGLSRSAGLTIPASTINRVVDQLLTKGRIARGYLGAGMQPVSLPDSLKNKLALPGNSGLVIVSIQPNGPSEKAGVLIGDILVTLDGKTISDTDDVQACLDPDRIGSPLVAGLVRGGELANATVTVGERPHKEE